MLLRSLKLVFLNNVIFSYLDLYLYFYDYALYRNYFVLHCEP